MTYDVVFTANVSWGEMTKLGVADAEFLLRRETFLQSLCTSLCSTCHGKNLSWFSVSNVSQNSKCEKLRF